MRSASAREVWRAVLGDLQMQLPRPTFETWLKSTEGVADDGQSFIVEAPTPFAVEWLERRMFHALQRTLEKVADRPLQLQLRVRSEGISYAVETRYEERADLPPGVSQEANQPLFEFRSLNPRYTFESFVVGPSNRLAFSAAQAVAETPGVAYNPLFLYSGAGLGKTHLLQAVGRTCALRGMSVLYVTSEQFTNEFISAIRTRTTEEFRKRYRSVQMLLVDDVQFLSGKEQTHEGFFHTFNDLHNSGNQVVVSSDRPPRELPLMEERLRSRFEWGLIADIQPPDLETRMAILASKADEMHVGLHDAVIELIAKRVQRNVRELEGSLNRMVAYAQLMNVDITLDTTERILNEVTQEQSRASIDPQRILAEVAGYYGLAVEDLVARNRRRAVSVPRQVAMYLLIHEIGLPPTQVGRLLGGRDHSTVIHGAGKINGEMNEDISLRHDVQAIKEAIFA
ncbi:MAG: chromosomal replication initiator protein DnaA [Chloroflexi bacterium]|nr:chromosomal replication initiator protein DnaA [Chloroflexota bacterium]